MMECARLLVVSTRESEAWVASSLGLQMGDATVVRVLVGLRVGSIISGRCSQVTASDVRQFILTQSNDCRENANLYFILFYAMPCAQKWLS